MKKGFTLVEIVISIALIAVVSLTVMQIYLAVERFEVRKEEEDYARVIVSNIHQSFIASPNKWQEAFHGVDFYETGDLSIYYDKDWNIVLPTETYAYRVNYLYVNVENGDEIYTLEITSVVSERRTILRNVDLGRMGVYDDGS
jgi:prepilin-type N-terminal cleavage/methylation domain-containing protein